MAEMLHIPDPNNPFSSIPKADPRGLIAQNTERIAVGLDVLIGLLAEKWDMDLKEVKDEHGNAVLRWRPRSTETTEGETEEPTDSKA